MRRVGARAAGPFERIAWDEALDDDRRALRRDRRSRRRPAGDPAVQLRRHHGPAAVRSRWTGASSTASARRCSTARSARPPARPAGASRSARRRHGPRAVRRTRADPDLGQQPGHVATCTSGRARRKPSAAARGSSRSTRIAARPPRSATEHIALLPGTDAALALGHDARADRRRPPRPRLRRPLHAGLRARSRARAGVPAGARRGRSAGSPRTRSWRSPATTAPPGRRPSASTTACSAHAGGGNAVRTIACLPALVGAWRDPAGGALLSTRRTSTPSTRPRSSVPT